MNYQEGEERVFFLLRSIVIPATGSPGILGGGK